MSPAVHEFTAFCFLFPFNWRPAQRVLWVEIYGIDGVHVEENRPTSDPGPQETMDAREK